MAVPSSPRSALPSYPTWRDHARWGGYLLASLTLWILMVIALVPWWKTEPKTGMKSLTMIVVPIAIFLLAGMALLWLGRCTWRAWRAYRFAHGHPSRREAQAQALLRDHALAVEHARAVAVDLVSGRSLNLGPAWDVNLDASERILFNGSAHYSRFYGRDVTYTQSSSLYLGSPLFVAAAVGAEALSNRARRNAALRQAAAQWREGQMARCLVTDQRVIIHRSDGQWLSFWFGTVTATYPVLTEDTLVLELDGTAPMRLGGPASLVASVCAVWLSHGMQGLLHHPGLAPLRRSEPAAGAEPGDLSVGALYRPSQLEGA